jgi:amino acid transporter
MPWAVLGTCLGVVATLMTVWRLVYRWRDHKLWWDDAWALAAMVNAWVLVGCVWVIFAPEGEESPLTHILAETDHRPRPPRTDSSVTQHARVVTFYLLEECFTFAIWSARLSILFTIIRITPGRLVRRGLHILAVIFVVFAVILGAQKFWVCIPQQGWTDVPGGTCDLGKQVALSEIISTTFVDILAISRLTLCNRS